MKDRVLPPCGWLSTRAARKTTTNERTTQSTCLATSRGSTQPWPTHPHYTTGLEGENGRPGASESSTAAARIDSAANASVSAPCRASGGRSDASRTQSVGRSRSMRWRGRAALSKDRTPPTGASRPLMNGRGGSARLLGRHPHPTSQRRPPPSAR